MDAQVLNFWLGNLAIKVTLGLKTITKAKQ